MAVGGVSDGLGRQWWLGAPVTAGGVSDGWGRL